MSAEAGFPISYLMQVEGDDEVKTRLSAIDGSVDKTGQAMEDGSQKSGKYSGALGQLSQTTESTKSRTQAYGGVLKQSALGISSVAASATNLYFQYDNLAKVQTRVEKAEVSLLSAKSQLMAAQERANKINEKGITSGAEYEKAQLDLQKAHDQVKISTDRVSQAQGDLTQSQMNFALGVLPTVFSSLSTVQTVMATLKAAKVADVVVTSQQSIVNLGAVGSFTTLTAATGAQTLATNAATTATRLLHIAMGPVGWVIGGIAVAAGLFATNAFGIRDTINALGKALGDAAPPIRWILEGLGTFANTLLPEARQETEAFETQFKASLESAGLGGDQLGKELSSVTDGVKSDFQSMEKGVRDAIGKVETRFFSATNAISAEAERIRSLGGVGPSADTPKQMADEAYRRQLLDAQTKAAFEEFINTTYPTAKAGILADGMISGDEHDILSALIERKNEAERLLSIDKLAREALGVRTYQVDKVPVSVNLKTQVDPGLKAIVSVTNPWSG
jgi:hypothetical protein